MGVLIDTCIWVDVERGALSPADVEAFTKKEPVYISPVTIAELTFGAEMAVDVKIKTKRIAALNRLKRKPLLLIDLATGDVFGRLAAEIRKLKKKGVDHRIQDLWLASQAIQHGFPILTWRRDFEDIPGLDWISINKN